MNATDILSIAVVLAIVIVGVILVLNFVRRYSSENLQDYLGSGYDHPVQGLGDEKKARTELKNGKSMLKQ